MTTNPLFTAVQYLAGRCDGARTQDGAGFNKFDSYYGKQLADKSFEIWSNKEKYYAWKMLRKYRKQLAGMGIDYDLIPIPIGGGKSQAGSVKVVELGLNYKEIRIQFAYRADLVTEVKLIPGRRWNPDDRLWSVPATPQAAALAIDFARRHDLEVDDSVDTLASEEPVIADPVRAVPEFKPVGRTITLEEEFVAIRFDYNQRMVESIGQAKFATWHKETKTWRVPFTPEAILNAMSWGLGYDFTLTNEAELKAFYSALLNQKAEAIAASQAANADIEIEGLGGELRPFQKAGVAYAVDKKRLIIGDEMGLGKTIEALATIHALNAFPLLIVCPASLKFNWHREAHKWLPGRTFQMLGGDGFGRPSADITIINYDRLKDYREFLIRRGFASMIGDESHYLKSPTAARTIYFEEIAYGTFYGRKGSRGQKIDRRNKEVIGKEIPVRLLLTGTPVMNRPNELIPQLQIIGRLAEFGGWWKFNSRYCGMFQSDFGHLKELNELLRARCFVRRLKKDVLTELPAKIRTVTPVEISNREEYQKAERDLIAWLRETKGNEKADAAKRAEQLVRINELKQLTARGKMQAIKEWVEDFRDTGEKLVIFGWHKEIVKGIAGRFNCPAITGDTPKPLMDQYVDQFQEGNLDLLSCNILTGGVGITLTAASNVLFCELGWNPAQMDQAGDRCHRIGQTDSVTEWWTVGIGTIDEMIARLIQKKREVVDAATDGIEPTEDMSIMNELIDELIKPKELRLAIEEQEEAPF